MRELHYDSLSRLSKEEVTIYEGVDANAPISVPNPNWLGAAFERTSQYDSHYGWVKAQYQGPKVANYSHDTRAKAGATTQVWRRDPYGHVVKEGAPWDDAAGVMGRQITALDPWGQATQAQLGNGLHTGRTTLLTTGQLTGICVGAGPGQCGTLDLDYAYDGWGNVTSHTQGTPLATESFGYDKLHRLTSSQRNGSAAVTLGYHPNGNLKYKSDYSVASESAYQYASKPHAVTQVTGLNNLKRCYTYDGAGNQLTHKTGPTCTAIERTMTYEIGHRPETIQGGSPYDNERVLFRYGSDGERYIQRQQPFNQPSQDTQVTLYPFPGYEVEVAKQGSSWTPVEGRQRLGEWGLWRASALIPQGTRVYWHGDRLGSPAAKSGSAGELIERHGFDAWGAGRNESWTPKPYGRLGSTQSPRGFTGHEHLDAMGGLIHMNGRGYDPNLGRFLSVDPIIQFPANSQSLNPYSYILNNPLAGTDPTGYEICGSEKKSDCTHVKVRREAPTGSHIKSNTVVSGNVADSGGSSASFSFTFDSSGKMISGSINSNGAQNSQGAQQGKDQSVAASEKGASSSRSNAAAAAGIAGTAGTLESAGRSGSLGQLFRGMFSLRGVAGAGALAWSSAVAGGNDRPNEEIGLEHILDAAWGDSLAEATRLRDSGSRSVVIGENQQYRVIPAALEWGADIIDFGEYWKDNPSPADLMAGIVFNAGWMTGVMANRMHIYDIGLEAGRQHRSPNYRIERQMIDLTRYPRYEQRWWEGNAGWDYLK